MTRKIHMLCMSHVVNAFLSRLELIWFISMSKMTKKLVFAKKLWLPMR